MHYVSAENLTKSYGIVPLFNNISFNINEGDKIAIIARNGIGKSTLLKILNGTETADEGKLYINKDVTAVLFEQDPKFNEDKTVVENIFHTNHPVMNIIREFELASDSEDGDALSKLFAKMEELNAWTFEVKVKQILTRLNIHNLTQPVRI